MGMRLLAEAGTFTPLVNIDFNTIIFTLLNTLIIFLLYRFLLHKKVCNMLEQRRQAVLNEMDEAKKARENAENAEKEYLEKLAKSKEEASEIITNATKKAQTREQEIISDAEKNAAVIKQKAEENIEREKKRAVNEIKNEISEIVIMAASKVAEKEISADDNKKLIDSFIVNVGQD